MENRFKEKPVRIINIYHLFWEFLLQIITKWKMVVLFVVITTLAGTGYAVLKNSREAEVVKTNSAEISVTEEEFANVRQAAWLYDALQEQEEYNADSIWMKCGEVTEFAANAVYKVAAGDVIINDQIAALYVNRFYGDEIYEDIKEMLKEDINIKFLCEVFEASCLENGLFQVKVVSYDKEHAEKLLFAAMDSLEKYKKEIEKNFGSSYELQLLDDGCVEVVDNTLVEKRKNAETNLVNLQVSYNEQIKQLSKNEQRYFNSYIYARESENYEEGEVLSPNTEEDIIVVQSGIASKRLKVDTGLGFILGIFCICAYFIIQYCWSSKIVNGEEIESMYHIPVLGYLRDQGKKRGIINWIRKKQRRTDVKETFEKNVEKIIARLRMQFKETDAIYLSGTRCAEKKYIDLLIQEGKKQGVHFIPGNNVLERVLEQEDIEKIDTVLLLEQENNSKYCDVENELQMFAEAKVEVCGVVVIAE